jgi:hypothetical protein
VCGIHANLESRHVEKITVDFVCLDEVLCILQDDFLALKDLDCLFWSMDCTEPVEAAEGIFIGMTLDGGLAFQNLNEPRVVTTETTSSEKVSVFIPGRIWPAFLPEAPETASRASRIKISLPLTPDLINPQAHRAPVIPEPMIKYSLEAGTLAKRLALR